MEPTKKDITLDLEVLKVRPETSNGKKQSIDSLIAKCKSGQFDSKSSSLEYPESRLHCELLILGDVEVLRKMERGEYGEPKVSNETK